ncbi:hypothetical protein AAG906_010611 [Vitis piasezkii]
MVERGGKTLIIITESKKGVSSWVRMGLNSVGLFMEGLHQCIEDVKEGRWEKGWKKKGRSFSLVRVTNKAGCFLRLGVVDLELKRYSICIPKGKGDKKGWTAMVEALRQMDISIDKKEQQEEVKALGRSRPDMVKGRSFADTVKGWWNKGSNNIRVEKLEPSNAKGEDLENLGWEMAKAWGLKGKIRMASLGKGRVLLELELAEEARQVLLSSNKAVGGVQLDLERWNPRSGCLEEGEARKEVWVRILGLPISLWVPSVLRRVGDACGGFLDVDPQTESMEELQWARILVRSDGENIPGSMEIGVEEMTYILTLWWEAAPSLRQEEGRKRGLWSRPRGEVRGDEDTRAGARVEEMVCAGFEAQCQSEDGTGRLTQDVGSAAMGSQAQLNWAYGLSVPSGSEASKGDQIGPWQPRSSGRAASSGLGHLHKGKAISAQAHLMDSGLLLKTYPSGSNGHIKNDNLEREFVRCREEEMGRRQQLDLNHPRAERMLEEEAARYGLDADLGGFRAQGSSSSNLFCFGRTPERECYDHSGVDGCWDLVEVNSVDPLGRSSGWTVDQTEVQEGRKEAQINWEESSLVKFSQFLGFSTEGLEKEILSFLGKIRKRREKIVGKGLLETSRFEREIKRLECSVNYEGDTKKKSPTQGRGNQSAVVQ